jgi:hypothetical protein
MNEFKKVRRVIEEVYKNQGSTLGIPRSSSVKAPNMTSSHINQNINKLSGVNSISDEKSIQY